MPAVEHPVRLVVTDELTRTRLTVLVRIVLAIPHLIWFALWTFMNLFVWLVAWPITLVRGRLPDALHDYFAQYVRYTTHFYAYLYLAADPYPGFTGTKGYPIDIEVAGPEPQRRWTIALRLLLAMPAYLLASAMTGSTPTSNDSADALSGVGVAIVVAFLGWFACLATGAMPLGMRNLVVFTFRYFAQASAFLFFLTDRYPNASPSVDIHGTLPEHPIRLVMGEDDLRRARLIVFFRPLLVIPHFVWLILWTIAVLVVALAAWFIALATGRIPEPLHGFMARYIRCGTHVNLFLSSVGGPFPGFTGGAAEYPIVLDIAAPQQQSRWKTALRLPLAVPGQLIASGLATILSFVIVYAWVYGLVTGRASAGLRDLGAYALRYGAQQQGYLFLLTDRYPYSGPERAAES
jgi:hypothetical protein